MLSQLRAMHIDRMSKLLALASSPNDQEALSALRSLKRLLAADEMDFVDLANLVRDNARAVELESERRLPRMSTARRISHLPASLRLHERLPWN